MSQPNPHAIVARYPSTKKSISLVPLIDVIFILVLFFMLSTNYQLWSLLTIQQQEPGNKQLSTIKTAIKVVYTATGYRINQQTFDNYHELLAYLKRHQKKTVFLQADELATVQNLVSLLEQLQQQSTLEVKIIP